MDLLRKPWNMLPSFTSHPGPPEAYDLKVFPQGGPEGWAPGSHGLWARTSPSPRPSPLGRGSIVVHKAAKAAGVFSSAAGIIALAFCGRFAQRSIFSLQQPCGNEITPWRRWCSLSPRERAGVRGKCACERPFGPVHQASLPAPGKNLYASNPPGEGKPRHPGMREPATNTPT